METKVSKYLFPSGVSEAYCNRILPHPPFCPIIINDSWFLLHSFFPHYFTFVSHCSPPTFNSTDITKEISCPSVLFRRNTSASLLCYILTYFVEDGCFY